jgi:Uma2 family endonuclease
LSESTANQDKIEKKQIYQDKLRVSEYFWYDPFNPEDLAGFVLLDGLYEPIQPNEQGWLLSHRLGLALVRWQGDYKGVTAIKMSLWQIGNLLYQDSSHTRLSL